MPRIKLANWYGDRAPGEEVDVGAAALKGLQRDGLVAEVLGYEGGGVPEPGATVAVNETSEPEPVEPAPTAEGRRKR
ncbi:hypothetical protein [Streptomyces sp. NPDC048256]|uniref:hypothetical protein n=1 Tax=Streptomyces sp. NPDC048256 TaxID=3154613 RepID=UPI003408D94C